jgi:hypothetical protein
MMLVHEKTYACLQMQLLFLLKHHAYIDRSAQNCFQTQFCALLSMYAWCIYWYMRRPMHVFSCPWYSCDTRKPRLEMSPFFPNFSLGIFFYSKTKKGKRKIFWEFTGLGISSPSPFFYFSNLLIIDLKHKLLVVVN